MVGVLHQWIRVVKCTDVEAGETIRVGTDPYIKDPKETLVEEAAEGRIKLADGSEVLESELSSGKYWHKFVRSEW